jgi:integrase
MKVAPHIFVRPGEIRHGKWQEIDFEKAIWTIPVGKMKARRTHAVPLSRQVLELLKELKAVTGRVPPSMTFPTRSSQHHSQMRSLARTLADTRAVRFMN